jgi:hypothetical protein
MMVELYEIPQDDPIRQHILVHSDEWADYPEGVLLKLVTLGHLVPESKLSKYYLFQRRLTELEQDLPDADMFQVVKRKMKAYPTIDTESQEALDIVRRFSEDYKDQPYRLNIGKEENLYSIKVIEEIEKGNPLRVSMDDFPLLKKFGKANKAMTKYEEQGALLYEWFLGAYVAKIRGQEVGPPPTDIIEDDPVIIHEIYHGGADIHVIVTDDVKLYRLALNKYPDTWVFRMSVFHHFQAMQWIEESEDEIDYEEELELAFQDEYGDVTVTVHFDSGNIEAWANKLHPNPDVSGDHYETIGIPWRKNIHVRNLEKKPMSSFYRLRAKTFGELGMPRSLMDERTHRTLKRSIVKSLR